MTNEDAKQELLEKLEKELSSLVKLVDSLCVEIMDLNMRVHKLKESNNAADRTDKQK